MLEELDLSTVTPTLEPDEMAEIAALLAGRGLDLDDAVEVFLVARHYGRLVACAGLAGNVVRCVALAPDVEGQNILPQLMLELSYTALERGHAHLFLYTRARYADLFSACGFHTVVQVPDEVVMMENTPVGISAYTEELSHYRRERAKVGACVLNANPFTLGHAHLLAAAAADCDYLHVFVVAEDASFVSFADRLALVRAGVAHMPERDHILVHPGSDYIVSKATFPTYFLKDAGLIDRCATAVDLLIFRQHIAPALGVTHRYVGTEPFCPVTRKYNADMHTWLEDAHVPAPPVRVVQVPRLARDGRAISATDVRRRLVANDLAGLRGLVPESTFAVLAAKYTPGAPPPQGRSRTQQTPDPVSPGVRV